MVIATSGSTGEPKGAELSAAALRHSARASLARLGARPGQRWLSCLPPSHISGLAVFVRSLLAGTDPVIAGRVDAAAAAAAGCDYVSLVPTQVRHLLDEPGGPAALAAFRGILLGGAAVPAGLLARGRGGGRPGGHHLRDDRDLRRVRVRRDAAGRGVGPDRRGRPDPAGRAGAVLRVPRPAGPHRGRPGRRLVRHQRPR